jgi:hypothetical protein
MIIRTRFETGRQAEAVYQENEVAAGRTGMVEGET